MMGFWKIAVCAYSVMAFVNLPVQLPKTPVKGPVRKVMSCASEQIGYSPDGRTFPISNPFSRWRLLFQGDCSCLPELRHHSKKTLQSDGDGDQSLGHLFGRKH